MKSKGEQCSRSSPMRAGLFPACSATMCHGGHPWSSVVSGCEVELVWDIHRAGAATDIVVIRLMKSEIQAEIGCNKCI